MSVKVAIVTGAGSGIGRQVSMSLAEAGFSVGLAGRREETLTETAQLIGDENCLVVPCDVTDEVSVQNLFARVRDHYGRVDLLFNNAGTNIPPTPIEEISVEQWGLVIDVNLTGMFLCLREAFRVMKDQNPQGGRIVNNGSVSASSPRPGSVPYTTAKHAVTGLTRCASLDGRKYNIACGQIDIGNAQTDMTQKMASGVPQADGSLQPEPVMAVENVGRAVTLMAELPLEANIQFMTVMATQMPLVGRG